MNWGLVPRLERKHVQGQWQNRVRGRRGTVFEECRSRGRVAKCGRGPAGGDGQKMRSPLFTSGQCCAESGQGNHAASGRVIAYSVETHRLRMSFLHIGGSQTHAKLGSSPEIEITLDNRLYT